jgi:hypothetical protein
MHALLRSDCDVYPRSMVAIVEEYMQNASDYMENGLNMNVSLTFVRPEVAHAYFVKELPKLKLAGIAIRKVDEYFYITKSSSGPNMDNEQTEAESVETQNFGLGISLPNADEEMPTPIVAPLELHSGHFWLLLIPEMDHIRLHYFSKVLNVTESSDLIRHARSAIQSICIRANQISLLQELNETRTCRYDYTLIFVSMHMFNVYH